MRASRQTSCRCRSRPLSSDAHAGTRPRLTVNQVRRPSLAQRAPRVPGKRLTRPPAVSSTRPRAASPPRLSDEEADGEVGGEAPPGSHHFSQRRRGRTTGTRSILCRRCRNKRRKLDSYGRRRPLGGLLVRLAGPGRANKQWLGCKGIETRDGGPLGRAQASHWPHVEPRQPSAGSARAGRKRVPSVITRRGTRSPPGGRPAAAPAGHCGFRSTRACAPRWPMKTSYTSLAP
jgi:hypothetical protein